MWGKLSSDFFNLRQIETEDNAVGEPARLSESATTPLRMAKNRRLIACIGENSDSIDIA